MSPSQLENTLLYGDKKLAYRQQPGSQPGVLFLGGFRSDMSGTKAKSLADWCRATDRAYTRFDYSGHGASSGEFEDGTISRWLGEATAILDQLTTGPQLVVGSSMGGWIALLLALVRPRRVHALVTIACATDFTERLVRPALTVMQRAQIEAHGVAYLPSNYDHSPYPITRCLLDDGLQNLLLGQPISIHCAVHMLHGEADKDVPWQISQETLEWIESDDVQLTLIKGGDHRLSKPTELNLIIETLKRLTL
ncbi:MAG: alpha/beta hydrolase [Candidatus Sedimenticola sp. (ex Thyasira tokunagai)]